MFVPFCRDYGKVSESWGTTEILKPSEHPEMLWASSSRRYIGNIKDSNVSDERLEDLETGHHTTEDINIRLTGIETRRIYEDIWPALDGSKIVTTVASTFGEILAQ